MKHSLDAKNLYTLCNGILEQNYKDKVLFIISVRSFISKITNENKLDVSEINRNVGVMLEQSIREDELINLGELSRGNSLELLSDTMLNKLKSLKDKNVAAEILSRAIRSTINDIAKINLTLQEKFSTKFNKIVDAYNERTDIADIEKIIEEMIKLKKEIEDELEKGNEYDLSSEEKAFFDALGADPEIKELMQDETLVQIAKDARARIRVNIRRLLIKYNYPPVKREGAVEQVIRQAELKYANNQIYFQGGIMYEYKLINLNNLRGYSENDIKKYLRYNGVRKFDECDIASLKIILEKLETTCLSDFNVSYIVDRLDKEFDLVKLDESRIINIELNYNAKTIICQFIK